MELAHCFPVGRPADVLPHVGQRFPRLAGPDPGLVGFGAEGFVAHYTDGAVGVIEHDDVGQVDGGREPHGQVDLGAVPVLGEEPPQGKTQRQEVVVGLH